MKQLFLALAGTFAAVPGLTSILAAIGVPPNDPYPKIFSAISVCCGSLMLLILYVYRDRIVTMPARLIVTIGSACGAFGFLLLVLYLWLFSLCVVQVGPRQPVYYPLWLSSTAQTLVDRHGGRVSAVSFYGSGGVQKMVDREESWRLVLTTAILLLTYVGISLSFTSAFGVIGFHQRPDL
jgi:hypothetical protein